jgi:hypothetical protein
MTNPGGHCVHQMLFRNNVLPFWPYYVCGRCGAIGSYTINTLVCWNPTRPCDRCPPQ